MSGKRSRSKGVRGMTEAAHWWEKWTGIYPGPGNQSRSGSDSGDRIGTGPWWLEVKLTSVCKLGSGFRQAVRDAKPGRIPVCYARKTDGGPKMPIVAVHADVFGAMIRELGGPDVAAEKVRNAIETIESKDAVSDQE